jgi:hypothetical protein
MPHAMVANFVDVAARDLAEVLGTATISQLLYYKCNIR